jgi:hypothetical protein
MLWSFSSLSWRLGSRDVVWWQPEGRRCDTIRCLDQSAKRNLESQHALTRRHTNAGHSPPFTIDKRPLVETDALMIMIKTSVITIKVGMCMYVLAKWLLNVSKLRNSKSIQSKQGRYKQKL